MEFRETQRFGLPIVLLGIAPMVAVVAYLLYSWYGDPTGEAARPSETLGEQALILLPLLLFLGFFAILGLRTRMDAEGLHYRFVPFHRKERSYAWKEVADCRAVRFRPMLDHGGWGIRRTRRADGKGQWAFTIKGRQGIQVDLVDGHSFLLGTQRTEAAMNAAEWYRKKTARQAPDLGQS